MPELPEVETICRQLAPELSGARIQRLTISDARWCAPQEASELERILAGARIGDLARRGKYLLMGTDRGTLALHLRMTGTLLLLGQSGKEARHPRAIFWLDEQRSLVFNDPRRFGTAALFPDPAVLDDYLSQRLGPEPFGPAFSPAGLFAASRRRKTSVKAFLLDQRVVAGIGNIYADEALFRAGIDPRKQTGTLSRNHCERLYLTIRDALQAGIDANGASIGDFRDAYGASGAFQNDFLVHRRGGEIWGRCRTTIEKLRVAGRATYICPTCQTRGGQPRVN